MTGVAYSGSLTGPKRHNRIGAGRQRGLTTPGSELTGLDLVTWTHWAGSTAGRPWVTRWLTRSAVSSTRTKCSTGSM